MKVWVVEGSDRYYDEGDTWLVGLYLTEQLAIKAIKEDEKRYSSASYTNPYLSYSHWEEEVMSE